jgi:hypothetical protein
MKTYTEFITEFIEELQEASKKSSKRQEYKHNKGLSSALVSAHRGDLTPSQNNKRHAELKRLARKSGHGFVEVHGHYIEKDDTTGKPRKVKEKSLRIDAKSNSDEHHGELRNLAVALGNRYNQDSVGITSKSRGSAYHGLKPGGDPPKGEKMSIGDFHRDPDQSEPYASYMSGNPKKGFVFKHPPKKKGDNK